MDKLRIRQASVVEGYYDLNFLMEMVDTEIYTTNGFAGMKDPALLRLLRQVAEVTRLEERLLPPDLDYRQVSCLRLEARQKLSDIRPASLGQASRISGVSPADIATLMVYLESREGQK